MNGTGKVTEAGFTRMVLAFAKLHGWRTAHFRTTRALRKNGTAYYLTPVQGDGAGFPDLVLCRGSRVLVAELKVGRGVATPEQDTWLMTFRAAGVAAVVWRESDWPEIEETLR